ncbi:hypothetical protein BGY98DRAFT_1101433 [Russula aff. rugulosa BPL654]|nr:hypothetical protein BGY98DRAFT_1101433 [Russula aff. rugulosa BPL654]
MLAHAPPLPLTVDYYSEDSITAEDENRILLALEQRHRVRHLRLTMSVQNLQKLVMAIDGEFPILEYLIMDPWTNLKEDTPLMLPETLQAPHLRHFMLGSFACPKRPRLHPTATGLVTLCLVIDHQSAYFQSNILLQWISSTPQLESLQIAFSFPVPNRDVERQLTHTPITTHITLPNLRLFQFRGVSAYLEAVICRITTPRLETLEIRLFNQLTFSVPRLLQFMNIVNVGFNNAEFEFKDKEVNVWGSFVSSAAQISNALSQAFSAVEHLTLNTSYITLLVWDGLVEELSRCLRLEDGELPLDLLPELQELTYLGVAMLNSDRPVTLVRPPLLNPNRP